MIGIRALKVRSYDLPNLTVEWEYEVQQPGVDLSVTTVDVQRAEAPDFSSYTTIAAGLSADDYITYTDTALSGVITRRYNDVYYRLRFVEADGEETITKSVYLSESMSLPAKEIIRRKNNILRLRGIPCYLLKRKTFGTPCTDCFDELTSTQIVSNCSTCYNTRIVGGFYAAISLKAFLTQTPDQNLINRFGEFNPGQLMFSITNFPQLAVKDVIVDNLNRRWWVRNVRNTSYRGYILAQDAVLDLVDHNDVVKDIEVQ